MAKLRRVLVANRGEIAVRIMRCLRDLGIASVAVYSDADQDSLHVKLADFAVPIGGRIPKDSYLRIDKMLAAIKASGADGVHPGFGFLSENPEFAEAVTSAGVTFIGPSADAMRKMGNKIHARELMKKHKIPVVPGTEHPLESYEELKTFVDSIGFPVILKAAAGGGGRGMRVVRRNEDLKESLEACQREALAYFNDRAVFCERYIDNPRHIEFQVLFDSQGNGVYLFERDCSMQRRNQKLIEEAPSQFLDEQNRKRLGEIAVRAAQAAGYCNAGTIEFICEAPDKAYFMEMNTRIQVEHPVTELITGVDLIAAQVRVAEGEPLPFKQQDLHIRGWAIELRINAEDPVQNFTPQPGRIRKLHMPAGAGIRMDSHLYAGYEIPAEYDSMVAKLIGYGTTRDQAIERLLRALAEFEIDGVPTTSKFHEAVLRLKDFREGRFHTQYIETHWAELLKAMSPAADDLPWVGLAAAVIAHDEAFRGSPDVKGHATTHWERMARQENNRLS